MKTGGKDHSSKDLYSNVKFESGKGNSKQTSEHVLETNRGSVGAIWFVFKMYFK